jgi:hypothetical protein
MEIFLLLNGAEISATLDDGCCYGWFDGRELAERMRRHVIPKNLRNS